MAGEVVQGREERAQQLGYDGYEVDEVDLEQEVERGVTVRESQGHEHGDEDGGHQPRYIAQEVVIEECLVPCGSSPTCHLVYYGDEYPTAQHIGNEDDECHSGYCH